MICPPQRQQLQKECSVRNLLPRVSMNHHKKLTTLFTLVEGEQLCRRRSYPPGVLLLFRVKYWGVLRALEGIKPAAVYYNQLMVLSKLVLCHQASCAQKHLLKGRTIVRLVSEQNGRRLVNHTVVAYHHAADKLAEVGTISIMRQPWKCGDIRHKHGRLCQYGKSATMANCLRRTPASVAILFSATELLSPVRALSRNCIVVPWLAYALPGKISLPCGVDIQW